MKTQTTLQDAFLDELRDTYDAEKQVLRARRGNDTPSAGQVRP